MGTSNSHGLDPLPLLPLPHFLRERERERERERRLICTSRGSLLTQEEEEGE